MKKFFGNTKSKNLYKNESPGKKFSKQEDWPPKTPGET
jgi:hypothetical protein